MKIIGAIFYTVFIAFVLGIAGLLLGSMLPIPGNIEIKIVKSGSMEPHIPTGSLVVVKPASAYGVGDVITFGEDSARAIPTTHRIVAVNPDGSFVTKGDANEEADPDPVARHEVIGTVFFSIPGAGYVLDFARTKLGFTLLIGIPAGLVILEEVLTIVRETQKWYRGRCRGGDEGNNAAHDDDVLDLRSHLKRAYEKRYAMDEIKIAIFREPHWYEAAWWKWRLGIGQDTYRSSSSLTVALVFFACLFAGHSGGTIAYFQDIETSLANMLRAGAWEPPIELFAKDVPGEAQSFATFAAEAPPEDGAVLGESIEPPVEDAAHDTVEPPPSDEPANEEPAPEIPDADAPEVPEDESQSEEAPPSAPDADEAEIPVDPPVDPAPESPPAEPPTSEPAAE